jgi:hypothetical protein
MSKMPGPLVAALCALTALPTASHADGVSAVFAPDGSFIDTIGIVGDVTMPSGETYVVLEMNAQHMRFYVDPDAIYVMLEADNPIITERTQFRGFWLDQRTIDNTDWPACPTEAFDENGAPYQAHGSLVWANTGLGGNGYELEFYIHLGTCDRKPQEWGIGGAATDEMYENHFRNEQSDETQTFTLTDANGIGFNVDMSQDGTTLAANDGSATLAIYGNCTAFAQQLGWGTWGWANGGFVIDFDTAHFAFPRQDAPIDNGLGCRL